MAKFYTIFDLMEAFAAKQEEEKKLQRTIYIDPEDRDATLNMLDALDQPLNCLKQTTIKADGVEHIVLEIGFMSTGERYGEIKARLELAGLNAAGKAKEVVMKKGDEKK